MKIPEPIIAPATIDIRRKDLLVSEGNGFLPASYQFVQTNLTIQTTLRKIEILILRRQKK